MMMVCEREEAGVEADSTDRDKQACWRCGVAVEGHADGCMQSEMRSRRRAAAADEGSLRSGSSMEGEEEEGEEAAASEART